MLGRNTIRPLLSLSIVLSCPLALAAEGGGGRPITGQQIYSGAGIIPPEPGWVTSFTSIYYDGSISGSKSVPINGQVSAGIDLKVDYTMANITHIWDTGKGAWNYASAIGIPVQSTDIQASVTGPRGRTFGTGDNGIQFADMLVTPIAAGYHFNATDHMSFALPIYLPTGAYDDNRLANAGQNTYTFMPTLAYTHLYEHGGEFSLMSALEYYTRDDATDYRNGTMFRLDALWTFGFAGGWNAGVVGGWIDQIEDDHGPTADTFNGFRGRSVGAGPTVGWAGKFADAQANVSLRWVPEFSTTNRVKGDGVSLNLTLAFL